MKLQNLFKKTKKEYVTIKVETPSVPKGLLRKCKKCGAVVFAEDVKERGYICPKCGSYFRMHAYRRIEAVADEGSFIPWFEGMKTGNPLEYAGYPDKVSQLQEKTGLDEAVITGEALIHGIRTALAVCDGRFLMASMGQVMGEKITLMVERATEENMPVIIFACSGGARMQEGMVSLMQMAKTSAALKRHSEKGNLYISVLTDPTTGGVTASFAMLGDVILAEPGALIGFAGPRVIEQTIGQKLPKGFQQSEFLLEHGFVDAIVERTAIKDTLAEILKMHREREDCADPKKYRENPEIQPDLEKDICAGKWEQTEGDNGCGATESKKFGNCNQPVQSSEKNKRFDEQEEQTQLSENASAQKKEPTPWERVLLSRRNDRPVGEDYIYRLFTDFIEMHGDRYYRDDKAVIGGIARFHGKPVTVIAQSKGHNTKENIARNFGMPSPDGYRKALRLMEQAQKFGRPVICLVDTPGAFCGPEAEERGQGEAIAKNLFEMSSLKIPVLSIVIGEGGSGGALAMAVADEVWMLENSVYSILSPEGYAGILWKDGKRAGEAAAVMKMTAGDLKKMKIIDKVFSEPEPYTIETMDEVVKKIDEAVTVFLEESSRYSGEEIAERRYKRFRRM